MQLHLILVWAQAEIMQLYKYSNYLAYTQVAEWQHNTTAIPGQIRVLADICKYLEHETNNPNGIYWSVENNGIGEACLLVINDFGEENIPGYL